MRIGNYHFYLRNENGHAWIKTAAQYDGKTIQAIDLHHKITGKIEGEDAITVHLHIDGLNAGLQGYPFFAPGTETDLVLTGRQSDDRVVVSTTENTFPMNRIEVELVRIKG